MMARERRTIYQTRMERPAQERVEDASPLLSTPDYSVKETNGKNQRVLRLNDAGETTMSGDEALWGQGLYTSSEIRKEGRATRWASHTEKIVILKRDATEKGWTILTLSKLHLGGAGGAITCGAWLPAPRYRIKGGCNEVEETPKILRCNLLNGRSGRKEA